METYKDYKFKGKLLIPFDKTSPSDGEIWIDTAEGKLAARINGSTVLLPLPSELGGGGGLTQEQIEDFVALMISDNSILDWTYTDNAASPGTLVAVLKSGIVTNTELADMAQATIKGRASGAGTGAPVDLSAAQVKTILALASTDISDFTTAARAAISVSDTSTLDLSYSGGAISGAVLDSPLLGGQTKAQIQADIIAAISGGASVAYDTLVEIQGLLQADDTALAGLTTSVGLRARYFAGAVPNGASTANVDHNLNLTNIHDFIARVVVAATGEEEEYKVIGSTNNRVIVSDETGANIAAGRRIFLTAGV